MALFSYVILFVKKTSIWKLSSLLIKPRLLSKSLYTKCLYYIERFLEPINVKFCLILIMKRKILKKLYTWKSQAKRKPLLLMGARQVGKTFVLKKFGELEYENTVYLNFEH